MAKQATAVAALGAPLLFKSSSCKSNNNQFSLVRRASACTLAFLLWAAFAFWIASLLVFPTIRLNKSGVLRLMMFAAPVLLISVAGTVYLRIKLPVTLPARRKPRNSPWTYLVFVDGFLGVVSAAELFLIFSLISYCVWFMINYLIRDGSIVEKFMTNPRIQMLYSIWQLWASLVGLRLGFLGLICMSFLFIPVTRGLSLFRVIDIPFEHAVRYHVWLGHLTMLLFTVHAICYCVVWKTQSRLLEELVAWPRTGVANLPGVIALVAGIALWMTSFGYVRTAFFELFFYTHQLYLIFVVFMAFHIGTFAFCICIAGIFLFMLDRFLRFLQSRRRVGVLSSRILPCGTIELLLPKPPGLQYNALSFVFLAVPKLSWLQWHPFSVSSSPYDADDTVSFLIKPLGSWTEKLQKLVVETNTKNTCLFMNVEGPYGHESDYYLKYKALVLVAGGIGVSPFVAILRDLLHRYNMCQDGLPEEVVLVWAVKSRKELAMLSLVDPESICPQYSSRLKLAVHAYVTREHHVEVEDAELPCVTELHSPCTSKILSERRISSMAASYNYFLLAAYVIVAVAGSFLVHAIMQKLLLVNRFDFEDSNEEDNASSAGSSWLLKVSVLLLSMLSGVVIFGGMLFSICHRFLSSTKSGGEAANILEQTHHIPSSNTASSLVGSWNTVYGQRPDLKELFHGFSKKWLGEDVGVLVCGPATLQGSVAGECKRGRSLVMAFHYHSVSFDL